MTDCTLNCQNLLESNHILDWLRKGSNYEMKSQKIAVEKVYSLLHQASSRATHCTASFLFPYLNLVSFPCPRICHISLSNSPPLLFLPFYSLFSLIYTAMKAGPQKRMMHIQKIDNTYTTSPECEKGNKKQKRYKRDEQQWTQTMYE